MGSWCQAENNFEVGSRDLSPSWSYVYLMMQDDTAASEPPLGSH